MLQYPETVAERPLLRFAMESLADGSASSLACYAAALPLGVLHNAILRCQDHANVVRFLWKHPMPAVPVAASGDRAQVDWAELHRQADASYRAHSNNNEFGLDNQRWVHKFREVALRQKGTKSDEEFLRTLRMTQEWVDLELLLRLLTEYGARPLLLSMPIHGPWYERCGVTYAARRAYYQELRAMAARHHAPVADFADHDSDQSFCFDYKGHLSPRGWVYYGEVLDRFVHDTLEPPLGLPAAPATNRPTARAEVTETDRQTAPRYSF
jgi:poly-D-alanine transfer protein DltD